MDWFSRTIDQETLEEEIRTQIEARDYEALTERARRQGHRKTRNSSGLTSTVALTILKALSQSDDAKAFHAIVHITEECPKMLRSAYVYLNQRANGFPHVLALLMTDDDVKNRYRFVLGGAEDSRDHKNLGQLVRIVIKENIPVLDSLLQELQEREAVDELVSLATDMDTGESDIHHCAPSRYSMIAIKCLAALSEINNEEAWKGMEEIAVSSNSADVKQRAIVMLERAGLQTESMVTKISQSFTRAAVNDLVEYKLQRLDVPEKPDSQPSDKDHVRDRSSFIGAVPTNLVSLRAAIDSLDSDQSLGLAAQALREPEYLSAAAQRLTIALSKPAILLGIVQRTTPEQREVIREIFRRADARCKRPPGISKTHLTDQWDRAVQLVLSYQQAQKSFTEAEEAQQALEGAAPEPAGAGGA